MTRATDLEERFALLFERDFPVVQGIILMVALVYLLTNLLVDLLYAAVDPRINYS